MKSRNAFTLVELIVVLGILIALGGVVVPLCSDSLTTAAETVTDATLSETRAAVIQYWRDTKHVTLDGVNSLATESQRFEIAWLFADPVTNVTVSQFDANSRIGWNGPYIVCSTADAVANGSPGVVDGWNQLLTVQYLNPGDSLKDVRIVSAGANGVVDIPANVATADLTTASIGDDHYVALSLR